MIAIIRTEMNICYCLTNFYVHCHSENFSFLKHHMLHELAPTNMADTLKHEANMASTLNGTLGFSSQLRYFEGAAWRKERCVSHLQGATGEVTDMTVESSGGPVSRTELSAVAALLDGDLQGGHALQLQRLKNTSLTC